MIFLIGINVSAATKEEFRPKITMAISKNTKIKNSLRFKSACLAVFSSSFFNVPKNIRLKSQIE